jgi:hypothetical protein
VSGEVFNELSEGVTRKSIGMRAFGKEVVDYRKTDEFKLDIQGESSSL